MKIPRSRLSGVYKILCLISLKFYIGSAVSFRQRSQTHLNEARKGNHHSSHFQNAWNKYGEDAFEFIILEVCEPEKCIEREQWYLDTLVPWKQTIGYNVSPTAGSQLGTKRTEEQRRQMSISRKGIPATAATAAAAIANKGCKRSQEFCENLSNKLKGRVRTEEHKKALSDGHWTKGENAEEIAARRNESLRGQKHTEEHKAKIGATVKENHWSKRPDAAEIIEKTASKKRGKKLSEEARANMAVGQQRRHEREREEKRIAHEQQWAEAERMLEQLKQEAANTTIKPWTFEELVAMRIAMEDEKPCHAIQPASVTSFSQEFI